MNKLNITLGLILISIYCLGQTPSPNINEIAPKIDVVISNVKDLVAGEPVMIKCEIINNTESTQKIEFTESHPYYKKLPYATCITSTIYDSNDSSLCRYGTQYIVWSTLFLDKDKQYITIKPKEKIVRELNISEISYDCTCDYRSGFKKGKYRIQVFVHSRPSNILEIEIK